MPAAKPSSDTPNPATFTLVMSHSSEIQRSFAMNQCRVEDGDGYVPLVEKHTYLGAAKDHRIRTALNEPGRDSDVPCFALRCRDAAAELLVDDPMPLRAVVGIRNDGVEARRGQAVQ